MRFTPVVVAGLLAVAQAKDATSSAAAAPTSGLSSEVEKCIGKCSPEDVNCIAHCTPVSPPGIHSSPEAAADVCSPRSLAPTMATLKPSTTAWASAIKVAGARAIPSPTETVSRSVSRRTVGDA